MGSRITTFALLLALSGCGTTALPSSVLPASSNAGLPASEAAQAEVEAASPAGFVLTSLDSGFLDALNTVVAPERKQLADAILADNALSAAFDGWGSLSSTVQLDTLKRVAALEARVMGCVVPPIVVTPGAPPQAGEMAFFQPSRTGVGSITLFPDAIAQGDRYLALDTVVHEMRHAAQMQLISLVQNDPGLPDTDPRVVLANGYAAAWIALEPLGGEAALTYGDYAHLNVEFDAFQTGNQVATLVSAGRVDTLGLGFVDTQYSGAGSLLADLGRLKGGLSTPEVVSAVNQAEYQLELTRQAATPRRLHRPFAGNVRSVLGL